MDILGTAADLLTGGVAGAAGGLLGSVFGLGKAWLDKRHEAKMTALANEEKAKDRAHDLALMDREAEIDLAKTSAEVTGRLNEADLANIHAGIEAEAVEQETLKVMAGKLGSVMGSFVSGLLFIAEFVRKMMRPVITTALVCATLKIYVDLGVDVTSFDVAQRLKILATVIDQILFLTGVAVCFWFLSRPQAGQPIKTKLG